MKRMLTATCLILLILWASPTEAQDRQVKPAVTLTLVRVRGEEFWTTRAEGPLKGQKIREVLLACDVIIDNQTGADLTVHSMFFSAFDGLNVVLLKDGKELREQSYIVHQSPAGPHQYVLKKGKNEEQLRFPLSEVPNDWAGLEVKIRGDLPGSKYRENLVSGTRKIESVKDLDK